MNKEHLRIEKLFRQLCEQCLYNFPAKGYTESIGVPNKQGVYIIFGSNNSVLHVGEHNEVKTA